MIASVPSVLMLLAHKVRWQIVGYLAGGDYRVGELVSLTREPQNLVSYHLKKLRDSHLVNERRSSADARDVYYSLNLEILRDSFSEAGSAIHPMLSSSGQTSSDQTISGHAPPRRVLFLCTHNSARSQMAEALLRHLSKGKVSVYSAGTSSTTIHPLAIRALTALGVDSEGQYSKSLDAVADQTFNYVVTVCDRARELCPTYPHETTVLHWSFADPAEVQGTPEQRYRVFQETAAALQTRNRHLMSVMHASQKD